METNDKTMTYSKYFEKLKIRPDRKADKKAETVCCQWDGCTEPGSHRAPVGQMREGEYFKFCLQHVQRYNKEFNYFSGVPDGDVARFQKEAMTGHRPTWRIGTSSTSAAGPTATAPDFAAARSGRAAYHNRMRDPYGAFQDAAAPRHARTPKPLEAKALETLGLKAGASATDVKTKYKELVKQHHPDSNGGDRASEDRLREVLQAYKLLKAAGFAG